MELQPDLQLVDGEYIAVECPSAALEGDGLVFPPIPERGRPLCLPVEESPVSFVYAVCNLLCRHGVDKPPLLVASLLHFGDMSLQPWLGQGFVKQPVVALEQGDAVVVDPRRRAQQFAEPLLMIAVL